MKIIVGVDGSESSGRAVEWCAAHAAGFGGEVVAVHSVEWPVYAASGFGVAAVPISKPPDHDAIEAVMKNDWCAPLAKAGVSFRTVVVDGSPAGSIIALAQHEQADLVVTGRRGLGGFKELLLGSTSHELSHHVDCPLVIVP
jgi:nucleotide-binding universal stress UspA family protein